MAKEYLSARESLEGEISRMSQTHFYVLENHPFFIGKQNTTNNMVVHILCTFPLFLRISVVVEEKKEDESTKKRSIFSRFGGSKDKTPATPPNTPAIASPTSESATSLADPQQGRTEQFFPSIS